MISGLDYFLYEASSVYTFKIQLLIQYNVKRLIKHITIGKLITFQNFYTAVMILDE